MILATPGAHLPPAAIVRRTFGQELAQLGATTTHMTGMKQVTVNFADAWSARYASETLRAVVDGVQMLYAGPAGHGTPEMVSSPTGQASFINRLDAITGYTLSTEHPRSPVAFHVAPDADKAKLARLIAPEFEGTRTKVYFAG